MADKEIPELDLRSAAHSEEDRQIPRKSGRQAKIKPEHAEYFQSMRSERLTSELRGSEIEIEEIIQKVRQCDAVSDPAGVKSAIQRLENKWKKYQEIYDDLTKTLTDSAQLQAISMKSRELGQRIYEQREDLIRVLQESASNLLPQDKVTHPTLQDDTRSLISMKSGASKHSSTSSKARAAARSAKVAKLKLEQAIKRSELKQRQIREQAELERTRVELEAKRAESELNEHLQQLQDEVDCAKFEAQLLADDNEGENGEMRQREELRLEIEEGLYNHKKSIATDGKEENKPPMKPLVTSTPMNGVQDPEERNGLVEGDPPNSIMPDTRQSPVLSEQKFGEPKSPWQQEQRNLSLDQTLATTLLQINQQLMSAMKQNSESTMVMKSMMQRQGIPKPDPPKFSGDPAEFPVFKLRMQDWLEERGLTEKEKISHLLSFVEGDPKEAIAYCEIEKNGYAEAMAILESQYGHPAKVVRACVKKITDGPKIERGNKTALTKLRNNLQTVIKALRNNERYLYEMNACYNLEKVIDRLPSHLQIDWAKSVPRIRDEIDTGPDLTHILSLVDKQVKIMNDPQFGHIMSNHQASSSSMKPGKMSTASKFATTPRKPIATMATDVKTERNNCICCKRPHELKDCEVFSKKTTEERWAVVKEHKLCHLCLASGHMRNQCRLTEKCPCKAPLPHHKLLHREQKPQQVSSHSPQPTGQPASEEGKRKEIDTRATLSQQRGQTILLHVVPVRVISNAGKSVTTYGLLDNASRGTIICSQLADELGIDGPKLPVAVTTVLGTQDREYKEVSFQLQAAESSYEDPILRVEQGLSGDLTIEEKVLPHEMTMEQHPHLSDIRLPQVELKKVTLIIGEDVRKAHIVQDVRAPTDDDQSELYATKTALGWTIAGRTAGVPSIKKRETSVNFTNTNKELGHQLERFWQIERVGIDDSPDTSKSVEDRRAEEILQRSTRLVDGHYETGLLWKRDDTQLPNNRCMAESRLNSLRKKFQRDPGFEAQYRKVIQEYIERGYARKLTQEQTQSTSPKTNYLPHHGVTNPNKPGKVRVVFDAAAKFKETSLNKNLVQGPDLANNLTGVLMRFRQDKIALVADIEGMFHQVKVTEEDQDALRFLWYGNGIGEPPDEYVMTSHIFGATDSPCCANYCLKKTAEDNRSSYDPVVIETVLRNFYVDDMLRALKSEEVAIKVAKDLVSLLTRGGFRLTKFTSNSRAVLDSIPNTERANPTLDLDLDKLPVERALGVQWNVEQDTFGFKVTRCNKPNTMRGVLSYVSSFYDPQGLAAPVVLPAKQILQECWKGKQTWDEPLTDKLLEKWEHWKNLLHIMTEVKIPRCFFRHSAEADPADIQLHHFCDASEIGYGTVSYLRASYPDGKITCSIVQGKSRNAPVRAPTIPRMELQSAVLAVRMDKFIQRELDLPISKTIFWTDSTITLYCILNESKRFQTYVANRVNEIREATTVEQWRHCPGVLNPADDCSRGLDAKQFMEGTRWLKGPQFLWEAEERWPTHHVQDVPNEQLEIRKERACLATKTVVHVTPALVQLFTRYSSWTKLLKSVAWIMKFIKWLKDRRKKQMHVRPTNNDLKMAKQKIVALVQAEIYPDEIRDLNRASSGQVRVKPSSKLVKLKPMINPGESFMRVSGRITDAPITYDAKHQMILPQHHFLTELIINHYHVRLGHSGPEHVLSKLREEFWIVKARAAIKKVLGKCVTCKKQHAERMSQEMADLPKIRVTPYEPAFTYTGIDYFGPLNVKKGRGTAKRYGCIFVCMTTRAIHLELAQSLETDAFIMVLRRFINTRGSVKQLRSDNGTNFVGAERELRGLIREWRQKAIEEELQQYNCEWIFHPPGASHMSGVWERLIRSVKRSMKAILGERTVDEEVLRTVLSEAQAIANSRPLCHNSDDIKDMEALTPNHLLVQRPVAALPSGSFDDSDLLSRKKWRQVQILANHFWNRWIHEYLPTLQERQKWLKPRRDLMTNDLVLIAEDNVPRGQWLLGRVVQVFPGRDGRIRSATIKTKNSELLRPITKLCLLEASDQ